MKFRKPYLVLAGVCLLLLLIGVMKRDAIMLKLADPDSEWASELRGRVWARMGNSWIEGTEEQAPELILGSCVPIERLEEFVAFIEFPELNTKTFPEGSGDSITHYYPLVFGSGLRVKLGEQCEADEFARLVGTADSRAFGPFARAAEILRAR